MDLVEFQNEEQMAANDSKTTSTEEAPAKRPKISLDTWAVIFALAAGVLIRTGVIKHIPW